jgi:hypothetical protein
MENALGAFTTLITLLPEIAIFILCIYYYSVKKTIDGLLLSIGCGIGLLLNAFFRLLPMISTEIYQELIQKNLFTITSVIGFVSSACYAVGLGLLIMKTISPDKN